MRREGLRRRALVGVAVLALLALAVGIASWASDGGPADAEASAGPDEASIGALLSKTPVGDEADDFLVTLGPGGVEESGRVSELSAAEEAGRVLDEYAAAGGCVVARSGWLDLLGRTWGCVIQGEGWVDVCVVSEREGGGSEVGVMHMDASGLRGQEGG